jgi:putative membrane protein
MVNVSRSWARAVMNFIPDRVETAELRQTLVERHIAYVQALRCQLRRIDPAPDVRRVLAGPEIPEEIPELGRRNPANGLLDGSGRRVEQARADGWIDSIQQTQIERLLVDMSNAQGGMERIKNTPLPAQILHPALLHPAADRPGRDIGHRHPGRIGGRGLHVSCRAADRR